MGDEDVIDGVSLSIVQGSEDGLSCGSEACWEKAGGDGGEVISRNTDERHRARAGSSGHRSNGIRAEHAGDYGL